MSHASAVVVNTDSVIVVVRVVVVVTVDSVVVIVVVVVVGGSVVVDALDEVVVVVVEVVVGWVVEDVEAVVKKSHPENVTARIKRRNPVRIFLGNGIMIRPAFLCVEIIISYPSVFSYFEGQKSFHSHSLRWSNRKEYDIIQCSSM